MIIGIDLGTTNSLAAHLTDDGSRLIPNALGEVLTPSVVGVDHTGEILVGAAARELSVVAPERCTAAFKRQMGNDWKITLVKHEFDAMKLSSLVLSSLKRDAEVALGEPVERAVITVPAYFNELQRQSTIRAGEMAGLTVARILNEPTAAALAYGLHEFDAEKVAMVFDLGGGTFDVSIVDQFDGSLEIRASAGETFLGGEDFTDALVSEVLKTRGINLEHAELSTPRMVSRLRAQCETAKRRLSHESSTSVTFPTADGSISEDAEQAELSQEQFKAWTDRVLARVELPLRRALGDAQLKRSDIDEVILVGGATRMPAISEQIERLFGFKPRCSLNPDEVVALGAAVQSGLIDRHESVADLVVTDVAPFTLGVAATREIGGTFRPGYFTPIIDRNTVIPVSKVQVFSTVSPNQPAVNIKLYQGENRMVDDNQFLGEFELDGIPPGPPGQPIEIRFTYDLNGVLEVEATSIETQRSKTYVVTRFAKGLSDAEIRAAIKQMESLKTHPREESVNRYILRRAERMFRELSHQHREMLEVLLTGFEDALERNEAEAIERNRDALSRFMDSLTDGFESSQPWSPEQDD